MDVRVTRTELQEPTTVAGNGFNCGARPFAQGTREKTEDWIDAYHSARLR